MTRRTIRFALVTLAAGGFGAAFLQGDVQAQGAGGFSAGGIKVVRAATQKVDLKIGDRYVVATTTGRVVTGMLAKMDATSITLKDAGGKSFVIPRKEIEEIRKVPQAALAAQKRLAELKKQQEKLRKALEARQRAIIVQRGRSPQGAPADRDDADPKDPQELVVLLSPRGPVIVEFAIYADGKPFRMMREAIIDDLMQVVESGNGKKDGKLTWKEALGNPRFSFQRFRYLSGSAAALDAAIRRYDLNGDGLVQRPEVRRYLTQLGYGGAFNVRPTYSYQPQPDVKAALDTDKDGVISAEELKAAPERLKSRDADDNDLLIPAELGGGQPRQYGVQFAGGRGMRLPTQSRVVFQLGPGANLTGLYNELAKHYGDAKKVVRGSAFRLDPELFKALDLNKNGTLEAGEMIGFHLAKPSIRLEIRIGRDGKQGPGVVVKSLAKGLQIEGTNGKAAAERLSISLPGWKLRILASAAAVRTFDYTRTAETYITRNDTDKNGYLDEKELKAQGAAGQYALQQFKLWDANGDGKVYAAEIKKSYERMLAPQMSQVTLAEQSLGPSLFAALDETGDGRLSLREMRNAGKRLLSLDRNKNGRVDPDEMPSEVSLTFSRGYGGGYAYAQSSYGRGQPASAPVRGPRWFYHMDKNGDGDVSLREFLGTKEQFQKLDTNRDGFIELKEAEAAGKPSK